MLGILKILNIGEEAFFSNEPPGEEVMLLDIVHFLRESPDDFNVAQIVDGIKNIDSGESKKETVGNDLYLKCSSILFSLVGKKPYKMFGIRFHVKGDGEIKYFYDPSFRKTNVAQTS